MLSRSDYRKQMRAERFSLSAKQQQQAAEQLLQQLIALECVQQANNIALYLANDGELDPQLFIDWCWQQQKSVYLPVIHPFSKGHLLFLKYEATTEMTTNQYGIAEPKLSLTRVIPATELDIIFTPLVAFDRQGNRLGMGGGFYDRTLANWYQQSISTSPLLPAKKLKPHPIGLAHDLQQVEKLPCEHWDIPLPTIITPTQCHHINIKMP